MELSPAHSGSLYDVHSKKAGLFQPGGRGRPRTSSAKVLPSSTCCQSWATMFSLAWGLIIQLFSGSHDRPINPTKSMLFNQKPGSRGFYFLPSKEAGWILLWHYQSFLRISHDCVKTSSWRSLTSWNLLWNKGEHFPKGIHGSVAAWRTYHSTDEDFQVKARSRRHIKCIVLFSVFLMS